MPIGTRFRSHHLMFAESVQHLGSGSERADQHGQRIRGLLALKDGKWVILRVPYPLGFYTKWMDGRIDNPAGCRLERTRALGVHQHACSVSHGRRQRHDEQGDEIFSFGPIRWRDDLTAFRPDSPSICCCGPQLS
jgi:hypothetical protein